MNQLIDIGIIQKTGFCLKSTYKVSKTYTSLMPKTAYFPDKIQLT